LKFTINISFFLILLLSCNTKTNAPSTEEQQPTIKEVHIPNKQSINLTEKTTSSHTATLHLNLFEFASEKLDSAIVNVILRPRIPDTFKRGFVVDYYKSKEGTYATIPTIVESREAFIHINALNYKGQSKEVTFNSEDTVDIISELWPLYPDSAQQIKLDQYKQWVKKESDKIKDNYHNHDIHNQDSQNQ